jgi:quercetin dioxygenase-like cupin family protein
MRLLTGILGVVVLSACGASEADLGTQDAATSASGITPTVLARGTYDPYKVMSKGAVDYKAMTKAPTDIVVRKHEYAAGGYTGWHRHPGPVFITVISGKVTFYEADDPTCTGTVVEAGQGYVDDGHGHYGVNETLEPAVDVTVIMAPVGGAFRSEIDRPGNCPF